MLKDIKLIIWDLDETLWTGTLSDEEEIILKEETINFIKETLDMGIVHSICSKNDLEKTKAKLEELKIWDYFVFPSIDWNPKGQRIKKIISDMNLRDVNVLFVDDNIQNLNEAKFYCKNIKTEISLDIIKYFEEAKISEKKDINHKRLNQYRILEQKNKEQSNYGSNEDFLKSCDIKVDIKNDCINYVDRIHDLIIRSNQLNYTKDRCTKEELIDIINNDKFETGYVEVEDKFGKYGIVGFYAIKDGIAVHFVFSCRTLGMLVEQYTYMMLKCPKINVVGEVVTNLNDNDIPIWINNNTSTIHTQQKEQVNSKIIMKGPCDMEQIFSFIEHSENIDTEFSYTNEKGILTEGHNNLSQISTSLKINQDDKEKIISDFSFFDLKMLDTKLKANKYDILVLSLLPVCNLGTYINIENNFKISLCEKHYNLTDRNNWKLYCDKSIFTSGIEFTKNKLEKFSNNYVFEDDYDYEKTIVDLNYIYNYLGKQCKIILLLGSERKFNKKCSDSYFNRENEHKKLNDKIRKWSKNKDNVILLPFDKYIQSENDFTDTINHFTKKVYYLLALDLIDIFNKNNNETIKIKNKMFLFTSTLKQKARLIKNKMQKKK